MPLPALFIFAFFLGSIPNAYLAGRMLKNIDIRQHGSGNAGATNAFRVLGRGPGLAVFLLDFIKGALPVAFYAAFFSSGREHWELISLFVGLAAVLGHMFTPFLKFKGGKGVATGAGVIAASFPLLFAVTFSVWVLVFLISRIVSLSSLAAVCALVISAWLTHQPGEILAVFGGMALLVFWSHRGNIKKLFLGQEHSFR